MPTVKKYERQVSSGVTPFVPTRTQPIRSRMGEVVTQAGRDAVALGGQFVQVGMQKEKDMTDRNDRAAAKHIYSKYGDEVRAIRTDLRSNLLGDSKGTTVEAQRQLDEAAQRLSGDLENDNQRIYFDALSSSKRESFLDSHAMWESDQMKKYNLMASEAMSKEAIQFAMENYDNPEAIQIAKDDIEIAVTDAMKGAKKEVIDSAIETKISELHEGIINTMAISNAGAAKDYYEMNKDEVDGDREPGIEKMLKTVGVNQWSMDKADEIMRLVPGDYEAQLEMADSIVEEEKQTATRNRIKLREKERRDIEAENERVYADAKTNDILQHHKNKGSYEDAMDIALQSPEGTQMPLIGVVRSLYLKEEGITNIEKKIEAFQMIDAKKIESRGQLMRGYMEHLSSTDWNQIEQYWQNGGSLGTLKHSTVLRIYQDMTRKDPSKDRKANAEFDGVWNIMERDMVPGQGYTDSELRKKISEAINAGQAEGGIAWGYGTDMSYAKAVESGRSATWLPDVSKEEVKAITKALDDVGDPVTDFTIKYYKRVFMLNLGSSKQLHQRFLAVPNPKHEIPEE